MADDVLSIVNADGSVSPIRTVAYGPTGAVPAQVFVAAEHIRAFLGIQSLVLTGSSQALTPTAGATHALIYAEGATANDYARYWQDGTAPSASVGKKLKDHEEMACASPASFKAINGSGSVTLRIEYYHYK